MYRETCNSGSLLDLKRDVEAKDITFECEDDPKWVIAVAFILIDISLYTVSQKRPTFGFL